MKQRKPSVLFVDDDADVIEALRYVFADIYVAHFATSGEEALRILAKHEIDVLVADQRMRPMSGTALCAAAWKLSPQTRRVILTAYQDLPEIVGAVNDGGVSRIVFKPFDNYRLRAIVDGLASKHRDCDCAKRITPRDFPAVDPEQADRIARSEAACDQALAEVQSTTGRMQSLRAEIAAQRAAVRGDDDE